MNRIILTLALVAAVTVTNGCTTEQQPDLRHIAKEQITIGMPIREARTLMGVEPTAVRGVEVPFGRAESIEYVTRSGSISIYVVQERVVFVVSTY